MSGISGRQKQAAARKLAAYILGDTLAGMGEYNAMDISSAVGIKLNEEDSSRVHHAATQLLETIYRNMKP